MAVSAALTEAPVLAQVVRSGVVESVHRATAVLTRPDGSIEQAWGVPTGLIFPRSANKPIQAVGMLEAGLDLPSEQLALVCASHSGESFHLRTALEILHGAALGEADLRNTPDYPVDEIEREAWIRAGYGKTSLAQNCSGKHAGMLATAARHGWDRATYLDPEHPVQQAITAAVERLTAGPIGALAVDGCGAPLHGIPLQGLAAAFGRIAAAPATAPGSPEAGVAEAIRAHPELLGGSRRQVTTLIRETPGLVAKDGAESVYAVGLADGRGIALKVADGHPRAKAVILAAILRRLGVGSPSAYAALEDAPVLGHGRPVGAIVAVGI
ncbi:MAG: asparaginase [Actinomycetales bacterium]|nr:asparaginase [Actinomycetales bacterium]